MISLDDSKLIQNREDNWVDLGMIEVFENMMNMLRLNHEQYHSVFAYIETNMLTVFF